MIIYWSMIALTGFLAIMQVKMGKAEIFIRGNAYTKQAYENKKYAFVSDVARLYALLNYGGIYLDTDVEVYRSFDEILEHHIERAKTFDRVEDQEQKERCQFFERCGLEDVSENF